MDRFNEEVDRIGLDFIFVLSNLRWLHFGSAIMYHINKIGTLEFL